MRSIDPNVFSNISNIFFISNKDNTGKKSTSKLAIAWAKKVAGDSNPVLTTHYNSKEPIQPPLPEEQERALLIGDVNIEGQECADPKLIQYLQSHPRACAILYTATKTTLMQAREDFEKANLKNRVICCEGSQLAMTCSALINQMKNQNISREQNTPSPPGQSPGSPRSGGSASPNFKLGRLSNGSTNLPRDKRNLNPNGLFGGVSHPDLPSNDSNSPTAASPSR